LAKVLVGPETETGTWYFSLNNRRLWVLKRCREEGLLSSSNNQIPVRVRAPKSQAEMERYTLEKCALDAKVIREKVNNYRVTVEGAAHCREASDRLEEAFRGSDDISERNVENTASFDECDEDFDDEDVGDQAGFFVGDDNRSRNRFSGLS
jgi:hypothetical protein